MIRNTPSSEAGHDLTPLKIAQDLKSQDLATQMKAVSAARSILCEEDPPIPAMVEAGIITPLVDALDRDCPNLQYRALDVLSIIAFGPRDHTVDVVNSEVIPKLIALLAYKNDLAERAIVTLGSYALHGPEARHAVLAHGAVPAMLPHMHTDTPIRQLRTFVRAFSNLCSHDDDDGDDIKLDLLSPALPYIHDLLDIEHEESLDVDDKETPFIARDVVVDACTALANMMLGPDECIEIVQAVPGLTARLVALLGHEAADVQRAALSAVGNMLAGTHEQVDRCLDVNCLDLIVSLLQSNSSLVQEAARAMGNILAGTYSQIQLALKKDVLTPLQNILADGDPQCQKQAVYAVTSLCCNGSAEQRAAVMSSGVLEPYCASLAASDHGVAGEVLDGLYELVQASERDGNVKPLCYMLDEFDILDQMQQLQEHTDEDHRFRITNLSVTLRKHAREERIFVCEEIAFTSKKIVQDLQSRDQETQARAARAVYCVLRDRNPPINALIEEGIMTPLVEGLDRDACSDLRDVAIWALATITAGTRKHRMAVVHSGAIPKLLALLVEGDEISELAACSLGNIASHGPEIRHAVLDYLNSDTASMELRTYVRGYINLCSQVRPLSTEKLDPVLRALPFVSELLNIEDREINKEASWACVYLMGRIGIESIEAVAAVPGLPARLVALLAHEDTHLRKLALTAMGNMLAGTESQTDRCFDAGCLDPLIAFLQCSEPFLVEEAARALSNILAGTRSHIQRVLAMDILTRLRNILADGENECQKQAVYAITNLCNNGSAGQHEQLVSSGVLEPYCALLGMSDLAVAGRVLCSLENLIEDAENEDKLKTLCLKLYNIGVLDQVQQFQEQEIDEDLRLRAVELEATLRQQARGEHVVVEDVKVFTLAEIVQELKTKTQDQDKDLAKRRRAAQAAWSMLSLQDPPITAMVEAGVTAPLVAALDNNDCSDLQHVAACALLNISAGTHKDKLSVVNAGAIPKLVVLLTKGGEIAETAAQVLGNLTSNALVTRDLVLSHKAVQAMLPHMRRDTPPDLLRSCLDAYKNFCLTFLSTSMFELASPALPYISELLDMEDQDILESACEAICNLLKSDLDKPKEAVQAVPGLTARLVALLGHEAADVQRAALSAVGNMLTGTGDQADRCLDAGCLGYIVPFLQCSDPILVQLALRAIRNILRISDSYIQLALEKDILTPIMNILADAEPNSYIQYDAVGALANVTIRGNSAHRMAVVNCGFIPKLVELLSKEAAVAESAASALGNITLYEPKTREVVLSHGAVQAMLPHMRPGTPLELLKICVMAYRNMCTGIATSVFELVTPALPYISELLDIEERVVLEYVCEALGNLVRGPDKQDKIEVVQAVPGLMARLVALLGHQAAYVRETALTAVMNMLLGNETQADRCLDAGCLDHVLSLLECSEPSLVELAAETSRNILAGTHSQIQRALDKGILTPLLRILAEAEPKSSLQYYAVYALVAISGSGNRKQKKAVIRGGAIPKLAALLSDETEIGELAGVALYCIAEVGPKATSLVLSHGGIQAMLPHSMRNKLKKESK